MAVDTDNEKLALMSYHQPFQASVPISSDGIGADDKKHLIWEFPGLTWSGAPTVVLAAQMRSTSRMVFSRVHGRVN